MDRDEEEALDMLCRARDGQVQIYRRYETPVAGETCAPLGQSGMAIPGKSSCGPLNAELSVPASQEVALPLFSLGARLVHALEAQVLLVSSRFRQVSEPGNCHSAMPELPPACDTIARSGSGTFAASILTPGCLAGKTLNTSSQNA